MEAFLTPIVVAGSVKELGHALGSGSPVTTFHNTLLILFLLFLSAYENGQSADEAFQEAMFESGASGDDSISRRSGDQLTASFAKVGLTFTPEEVKTGEVVVFLARMYMPWYGDASNCCDILRQLERLHLSGDKGKTTDVVFNNKIAGYAVTDAHAPLFDDLVKAWKRLRSKDKKKQDAPELESWRAKCEDGSTTYYLRQGWMDEQVSKLGVDAETFRRHCEGAKTIDELRRFPVVLTVQRAFKHHDAVLVQNGEVLQVPVEKKKVLPEDAKMPAEMRKLVDKEAKRRGIDMKALGKQVHGFAKRLYVTTLRTPTAGDWEAFMPTLSAEKKTA